MKVILAGYNLDRDVIDDLRLKSPSREDVTPETLSAAYARISRDPRPADVLRAAARAEVERARRSNQTIIFKMGHHSVAEHAVFNFDLIGLSRLAIEEVERFRLCSYTEKSQRYIMLGDDFVVPEEIRQAGLEDLFVGTVRAQNALYHELYSRLKPYIFAEYSDLARDPGNQAVLDGWAKEDARYVVSLATEGQLGMTLNARNLELLIRRFAGKELVEVKELGRRIYGLAKEVAPSIVLFTDPTPFDAGASRAVEEAAGAVGLAAGSGPGPDRPRSPSGRTARCELRLVDSTPDGDSRILAALVHSGSDRPYEEGLKKVKALGAGARKKLVMRVLEKMEFYDFPPREFEYAGLTFSLVVSASCFAQLKRHRMAVLTAQRYDPALGVTVPPTIAAVGATAQFEALIRRTNEAYGTLKPAVGPAADYVLTNAHRRRALLRVNVRELYHLSRLREDESAQWDIRKLAAAMSRQARKTMPLCCLLLGGKDSYPETYRKVFGRPPKMVPPKIFR